ncbi:helix-turn-helix domain-containing protein [Serratia sp. DD3]|uniref:helix-turn-helix domain-containing protein n=1 Tax=Serratia sp. DD3 TaxID=1410619 RepID=UPI0004DB0472|nr:helix-turn-helix domain-containing protein [Serratia sp. DD3]KEY60405.1 PTS-dependent dihydroxyacetone kinase operon regulatory protein [Serratia sp. DD3]
MRRSSDKYKKWRLHTQNRWPAKETTHDFLVHSWQQDQHLCALNWLEQDLPPVSELIQKREDAAIYLDYLHSTDLSTGSGENSAWCLLDCTGCVIFLHTDPALKSLLAELGIREGFSFDKALIGTTAFSICQTTQTSTILHSYETYKKALHTLAMVCTPSKNSVHDYYLLVLLDETSESRLYDLEIMLQRITNYRAENLSKVLFFNKILDELPMMIFVFDHDGSLKFRNGKAKNFSNKSGIVLEEVLVFNYTELYNHAGTGPLKKNLPHMRVTADIYCRLSGDDTIFFVTLHTELIYSEEWKYHIISQCLGKDSFLDKALKQRARSGLRLFLTSEIGAGDQYVVDYITKKYQYKKLFILDCQAGFSNNDSNKYINAQFLKYVEEANEHILCIKNIDLLNQELQSELIKVLSTGLVRKANGQIDPVNIEIICCSYEKHEHQVAHIRRMLFFMLSSVQLEIKSLSSDKAYLSKILDQVLTQLNLREKTNYIIVSDVKNILLTYRWPGNFLEVFQVIENAILQCNGNELTLAEFPTRITKQFSMNKNIVDVADIEKNKIIIAWHENGKRISQVAQALGVSRSTLWRKMKKIGLDRHLLVDSEL